MFARLLIFCALASAPACAGAAEGDAYASDWASAAKSQVRLIAAGPAEAGLEIRLSPGAITYWRDPGDAGVPPRFDFAGSVNLARAEPSFPAPTRIVEADGSEAFGYRDEVVFPIAIEARDPTRPVTLALNANFAVCESICLPAKASLSVTLPVGVSTPFAKALASARAQTPRRVEWSALGGELAAIDAGNWRLCAPAEPGPPRDLFVEAPAGWWLSTRAESGAAGRACFAIALREKPRDGAAPLSVRATITGGAGPLDVTLTLPSKS